MYKSRLHSLDGLRTLASLAVVVAHWPQHFFSVAMFSQPASAAPFNGALEAVYRNGASAVTFFFCLSGFVFYWLYGEAVYGKRIGFGRFARLRISRLYPLHALTLCLLGVLLLMSRRTIQSDFIYGNNDWYHLALNVLFVHF